MRNEKEYLIEWKPLHLVVSATIYAELKKIRRASSTAPVDFIAFGDPQYQPMDDPNQSSSLHAALRSDVERGVTFTPLPFTREEVESIAALYPDHSQKYLGALAPRSELSL